MKFSTLIPSSLRPAWYAAIIILATILTQDVYTHLVVMRQAPLFFKLLIGLQICVAVNIGLLNASMCAGQGNPIDILLNSAGLLILNDMDNVVGSLITTMRCKPKEEDEEESDLFGDNIEFRD